jgi:hypothetical protein
MTTDATTAMRGFQYKHGDRPLDGYTIQRGAGRGGFGEVYYALSDSGREVALKLVHTYEQIELRGISQCMNLKSPQLVTIFDVKHGLDGRPWVIMEFVSGPSLRELLDAAPSGLGADKSAFFLREIGKGLTYLHDCGIVHRDLKPGNIFYENGCVKIGDYGLSKSISMSQNSGQTVTVGTLHYMAPEIGEGKYDRSIDIYAMGALLYEMLTGQVPFYGSSPAEVLMKHLSSQVNLEHVEEPFKTVIRKAMAKNPAERYQSIQEMVEAVFGSEHIRNSVSQFSPQSLTMVAGRAVAGIAGGQSGSAPDGSANPSTAYPQDRTDCLTDRFNRRMARAGERLDRAGERFAERMDQFGQRIGKRAQGWGGGAGPATAPSFGNTASGNPGADRSMSKPVRIFLSVLAAFTAAMIVMINVNGRHASELAMFVFLNIVGATVGAGLSWRFIEPAVRAESKWFRRIAIGAPIGFLAALFTIPFWIDHHQGAVILDGAMLAIFGTFALMDWEKRKSPYRKDRILIGCLFTAGICGAIFASMSDADGLVVIATVVGASLAASLCAAWSGGTAPVAPSGQAAPPFVPAIPPIPPVWPNRAAPNATAPPAPNAPAAPLRPLSASASPQPARRPWNAARIFSLILCLYIGFGLLALVPTTFHRNTMGPHAPGPVFFVFLMLVLLGVAMSVFRGSSASTQPYKPYTFHDFLASAVHGTMSVFASLMLLASLLIALAVAVDLPGLANTGSFDQRLPRDMTQTFGTVEWPRLMREIGTLGAFVIAVPALGLMLLGRRRRGALYMLRGLVGVGLLFASIGVVAHVIPEWQPFGPGTPGVVIDEVFQSIYVPHLIMPLILAIVGFFVLCLPPGRRRQNANAVVAAPVAAAPASPPPIPNVAAAPENAPVTN